MSSFSSQINNYYKNQTHTSSCLHNYLLIPFIIIFCERLHKKVTKIHWFHVRFESVFFFDCESEHTLRGT